MSAAPAPAPGPVPSPAPVPGLGPRTSPESDGKHSKADHAGTPTSTTTTHGTVSFESTLVLPNGVKCSVKIYDAKKNELQITNEDIEQIKAIFERAQQDCIGFKEEIKEPLHKITINLPQDKSNDTVIRTYKKTDKFIEFTLKGQAFGGLGDLGMARPVSGSVRASDAKVVAAARTPAPAPGPAPAPAPAPVAAAAPPVPAPAPSLGAPAGAPAPAPIPVPEPAPAPAPVPAPAPAPAAVAPGPAPASVPESAPVPGPPPSGAAPTVVALPPPPGPVTVVMHLAPAPAPVPAPAPAPVPEPPLAQPELVFAGAQVRASSAPPAPVPGSAPAPTPASGPAPAPAPVPSAAAVAASEKAADAVEIAASRKDRAKNEKMEKLKAELRESIEKLVHTDARGKYIDFRELLDVLLKRDQLAALLQSEASSEDQKEIGELKEQIKKAVGDRLKLNRDEKSAKATLLSGNVPSYEPDLSEPKKYLSQIILMQIAQGILDDKYKGNFEDVTIMLETIAEKAYEIFPVLEASDIFIIYEQARMQKQQSLEYSKYSEVMRKAGQDSEKQNAIRRMVTYIKSHLTERRT